EEGCYLVRVELFDVAQEEDAAVVCRQAVDGVPDHRARLPALEQHVARRVPGGGRLGPVPVLVKARQQAVDRLLAAAAPPAELHECGVEDDAMEPCRQSRRPGERVDGTKGREEGFLDRVASVVLRADQPPSGREHAAAVLADERLEGVRVPGTESLDERAVAVGRWGRLRGGRLPLPETLAQKPRAAP